MKIEQIHSKKKLLLLGSGELGKEFVIESQRLGCEIMAIDKYPFAPAMQVADHYKVINMNDSIFSKKRILLLVSGELGKELVIESKR